MILYICTPLRAFVVIAFSVLCLFSSTANSQTPPDVNWDSDPAGSGDKYSMSWMPVQTGQLPDNYFYHLQEAIDPDTGPNRTVNHYVDTNTVDFISQENGDYIYKVRVCYFDEDRLRICGNWSSTRTYEVDYNGYTPPNPSEYPWNGPEMETPTGPDVLFPGQYSWNAGSV